MVGRLVTCSDNLVKRLSALQFDLLDWHNFQNFNVANARPTVCIPVSDFIKIALESRL